MPAANYIQIPSEAYSRRTQSKHALMLTGKAIYIELKPMPGKVLTFHLDLVTTNDLPLRLSFSTIFSEVSVVER